MPASAVGSRDRKTIELLRQRAKTLASEGELLDEDAAACHRRARAALREAAAILSDAARNCQDIAAAAAGEG